MKTAQFIKILSGIRQADDMLGEAVAEIAFEVLSQWHQHGNKTPQMMLLLAIDGGEDENGWFTTKGAELRGVSRGIASLFAGLRRLPKRDESTDIETAAQLAVDEGMRTRNEAKAEAKAKREANSRAKAKAEAKARDEAEDAAESLRGSFALVHPSGTVIELTEAEFSALSKTLTQLRTLDAADVVDVIVTEVGAKPAADTEAPRALALAA